MIQCEILSLQQFHHPLFQYALKLTQISSKGVNFYVTTMLNAEITSSVVQLAVELNVLMWSSFLFILQELVHKTIILESVLLKRILAKMTHNAMKTCFAVTMAVERLVKSHLSVIRHVFLQETILWTRFSRVVLIHQISTFLLARMMAYTHKFNATIHQALDNH